jgi:hypothetical protein
VPEFWAVLRRLAAALGCPPQAMVDPVPFAGSYIDVLGLTCVIGAGERVFPDVFVDTENRLFNARPELSVNQIMMNANGTIWPGEAVSDLRNGVAKFKDAPLGIRLRQVLRALRTCRDLDLRPTNRPLHIMYEHLLSLEDERVLNEQLKEDDTLRLLQDLLGTSSDPPEDQLPVRILYQIRRIIDQTRLGA